MSKIETVRFYGRTESEIEQNFLEWQKEYAGRTRIVKKHDIERLQPGLQTVGSQYRPLAAQDTLTMLVEYENKSAGR